jgi:hypothetical protein
MSREKGSPIYGDKRHYKYQPKILNTNWCYYHEGFGVVFLPSHSTIIILFFSLFLYPYLCVLGLLCKYYMCSLFILRDGVQLSLFIIVFFRLFPSHPFTNEEQFFTRVFVLCTCDTCSCALLLFVGCRDRVMSQCWLQVFLSSLLSKVFDLDPCCCLLFAFSLLGFTIMVIIFAHLHPLLVLGNYKLIK